MMTDVQQRNAAKHFAEFWKNILNSESAQRLVHLKIGI